MVRRQRVSKTRIDSFEAKGQLAGRQVIVHRLGDVAVGIAGELVAPAAVWELKDIPDGLDRVPITGYLLPASFHVEGLGFDLTYDVGYVKDGKKSRYGVTRIEAGQPNAIDTLRNPATHPVNVERVTEAGLIRLALRASLVHGFAYKPGTVVDRESGEVTGMIGLLEFAPNGVPVIGVAITKDGRTDGVLVRHGESTQVQAIGEKPVALLRSRESSTIPRGDERLLTGKRPPGRRTEELSDTDLRLVARLYKKGYDDPLVTSVPRWVANELALTTNGRLSYGGLPYSESWVRKKAVEARRRGFLKEGKRNKKGGKR